VSASKWQIHFFHSFPIMAGARDHVTVAFAGIGSCNCRLANAKFLSREWPNGSQLS
jgi:hypothetical protein